MAEKRSGNEPIMGSTIHCKVQKPLLTNKKKKKRKRKMMMKLPAQLDNNSGGGHWGSLHQAAFISGQSLSAPGQAILLCLVVLVVLGDVRCLQTNRHRWYIFCCQVGSVSVGPVFALENRRSQLLAPRTVAIAIRLRLADKSRGIYHCCPN